MNRTMELDIWGGDWGLPSIDLKCLQILTLAKISRVQLQVNVTNNPFKTPKGILPVFRCGKVVLDDLQEIAAYFRRNNYNSDFGLSNSECADVFAYTHMLQEKLLPIIQYTWWVDAKNFSELSRPWYAKALPFPLNFYYPGKYEKEAKLMVEAMFDVDDLTFIESVLLSKAEVCLGALAARLGDAEFFSPNPSSLDATVYAYLAPILNVPFPSSALQNCLKNSNNLVAFVHRMSRKYFPECIVSSKPAKPRVEMTQSGKDGDTDFPYKRRNQIFAGLFATIAMAAYAFSTGLVTVSTKRAISADDAPEGYPDLFDQNDEGDDS
ncbi:metaxin-1 [Ischnura elegans]|uniref:metaxin-1 n=1 Tax=Ischnura elegans TaxID=197161 RepID=UPI001ED880B1|nr:metaxin-1 [Ischnura elegans]